MNQCPSTEQQWSQLQNEAPLWLGASRLHGCCGSAGSQGLLCWGLHIRVCPSSWFEPNVNVLEMLRLAVRVAHKGMGRNLGPFPVEESSICPKAWEGLRATDRSCSEIRSPSSLQPLILLSELQMLTQGLSPPQPPSEESFVSACSVQPKNPSTRGADLLSDFCSVQRVDGSPSLLSFDLGRVPRANHEATVLPTASLSVHPSPSLLPCCSS